MSDTVYFRPIHAAVTFYAEYKHPVPAFLQSFYAYRGRSPVVISFPALLRIPILIHYHKFHMVVIRPVRPRAVCFLPERPLALPCMDIGGIAIIP